MTAVLLDGRKAATHLREELKKTLQLREQQGKVPPGLAVILVGSDPASEIYVQRKHSACLDLGLRSYAYNLPATSSEAALLALIQELNASQDVQGILLQLPLPAHISSARMLEAIHVSKDVDGFHPYNQGCLLQKKPRLRPCTPYGIIQLLNFYQIPIQGKHAVVIGASNIVGRPMGLEFLLSGATLTLCHSLTTDLEKHVRAADILVLAAGIPDLVQTEWLHSKQVVVDVGIHRLDNGRIRGDLDFEKASAHVAAISPVPGGVGPMTITALLQNTLLAASLLEKDLLQNENFGEIF